MHSGLILLLKQVWQGLSILSLKILVQVLRLLQPSPAVQPNLMLFHLHLQMQTMRQIQIRLRPLIVAQRWMALR